MANSKELKLEIITPERQVVSETTRELVVITAHDGEIGILPQRAALMCELGIGQVRYRSGGQTRRVLVNGGFAQVLENEVVVLTPEAIPAADVTDARVAEAEKAASQVTNRDQRAAARRRVSVMRQIRGGE